MNLPELLAVALALSMDAFAAAVCLGLSIQERTVKKALKVGLYFGFFQALMPLLGYFIFSRFSVGLTTFSHWIALILLTYVGGKMIRESFIRGCKPVTGLIRSPLCMKRMIPLSVATSIDALAAGVSFAFLRVVIFPVVIMIGLITLLLSILGLEMGSRFGIKLKQKAEFIGGLTLILIGIKIALENTGVFGL